MKRNKNEHFIKLPLDEILRMNAYYEKKDKTSQRYKVFTNEQNDLVIVSRNEKGHYVYKAICYKMGHIARVFSIKIINSFD